MRLFLAAILVGLAGCDFTPTLDIETPEFAPALTINGVLAADSTVQVSITAAADPYGDSPLDIRDGTGFEIPSGLTAELLRDGVPVGPLVRGADECPTGDISGGVPVTYPCGTMESDVVAEPGVRYTIRAQAPGYPLAEASVTIPRRPAASISVGASRTTGPRTDTELTVTLQEPSGLGQFYALMVVTGPYTFERTETICANSTCSERRDTTYTYTFDRVPVGYTTSDPVLLAGARTIPATGINFVTFTDESFDGRTYPFPIRVQQFTYDEQEARPLAGAWVVSIDAATFGAYQIAWFSLGDDNPFQEPIQLPSNVDGGYGILGAVAITEVPLPE